MKPFLIAAVSIFSTVPFWGICDCCAKTRWSSLHSIPDADLLSGGKYLIDFHGFIHSDFDKGVKCKPTAMVSTGITEWINMEAGYAGGPSLALKARILGETSKYFPSIAVGIQNVFSHKDAYNFGFSADSLSNELFLAFAKSAEAIRLRFHLGIQSIPHNINEKVNFFIAAEKYLGSGVYLSIEGQMRNRKFYTSFFSSYRILKRQLEFGAGLIDIGGFFDNDDGKLSMSFKRSGTHGFTRPGIFLGMRFLGVSGWGKNEGLAGLEDRISGQNESLMRLQDEIDSLKSILKTGNAGIHAADKPLRVFSDSSQNRYNQLKSLVLQKLVTIKMLFEEEPFEPETIKKTVQEIILHGDSATPALREISLDREELLRIRTTAAFILGKLASRSASDALIEILTQTQVPEIKIEVLIGLGKIRELRAWYFVKQLTNDSHEGVAFTAREVLLRLEKETERDTALNSPVPPSGAADNPEAMETIVEEIIHSLSVPAAARESSDSLVKQDSSMVNTVPPVANKEKPDQKRKGRRAVKKREREGW